MSVDGRAIYEYYERAAREVSQRLRRQDEPEDPDPTGETSSTSSSSTQSSTSSSSTSSSSSTPPVSSTSSTSSVSSTSSTAVSSTSSSASESSTSSEPESISTILTTTLVTTNDQGQSVTTILVTSTSISNPHRNPSNANDNTGAIVGGVLGGVALLGLLIGGIILLRRKRRRDELEANIFDPDRNVQRPMSTVAGPGFDIAAAAIPPAARSITPYSYGVPGSGSGTHAGSSVGAQPELRPASGYYGDVHSDGGYAQSSSGGTHYPPSSYGGDLPNPYASPYHHPTSLMPGVAAAAGLQRGTTVSTTTNSMYSHHPSPNSPQFGGFSSTQSPVGGLPAALAAAQNPRSAKEREAFRRQNFTVANQTEQDRPVVVHQDGGRMKIPEDDEDQGREAEIPPTYDSIPQEQVRR